MCPLQQCSVGILACWLLLTLRPGHKLCRPTDPSLILSFHIGRHALLALRHLPHLKPAGISCLE